MLFRCVPHVCHQWVTWVLDCGLWHGSVLTVSAIVSRVRSTLCRAGEILGCHKHLPEVAFLSSFLSTVSPVLLAPGSLLFSLQPEAGASYTHSATHLLQPSLCLGLTLEEKPQVSARALGATAPPVREEVPLPQRFGRFAVTVSAATPVLLRGWDARERRNGKILWVSPSLLALGEPPHTPWT